MPLRATHLDRHVRNGLFRAVRELLINVGKHADTSVTPTWNAGAGRPDGGYGCR